MKPSNPKVRRPLGPPLPVAGGIFTTIQGVGSDGLAPALNGNGSQVPTEDSGSRHAVAPPPFTPENDAAVPCLYQANPLFRSRHRGKGYVNRSPTESVESRCRWARRQRLVLTMLHRTHPPMYEATVKFLRPIGVQAIREFDERVGREIRRWSKRHGKEFAVYFVREIERNNCVHYHFLIRTAECEPWLVLPDIIDKASNHGVWLRHCKPLSNVHGFTRYIVKDLADVRSGERPILLFKPRLGLHLSGAWNGYFVRKPGELWNEWKRLRYGAKAKLSRGPS